MPTVVLDSSSQLRQPRLFLRCAARDLSGALGLARMLFRREVARKYRHSTLGIFWAAMPAIGVVALLTAGQRAGFAAPNATVVPTQLVAVFGMLFVQTFLEAFAGQRSLFTAWRNDFAHQTTPIEALALAGFGECSVGTAMRLLVLAIALACFGVRPGLSIIASAGCFVLAQLLGAGVGLLSAPWNALSRNAEHLMWLVSFGLLGTTPVFFPLPGAGFFRWVCILNPLTHALETARWLAWGGPRPGNGVTLLLIPASVFVLVVGWLWCRLCLPYLREHALSR